MNILWRLRVCSLRSVQVEHVSFELSDCSCCGEHAPGSPVWCATIRSRGDCTALRVQVRSILPVFEALTSCCIEPGQTESARTADDTQACDSALWSWRIHSIHLGSRDRFEREPRREVARAESPGGCRVVQDACEQLLLPTLEGETSGRVVWSRA